MENGVTDASGTAHPKVNGFGERLRRRMPMQELEQIRELHASVASIAEATVREVLEG
jgi:hypothetical protein